MDSAAQCGFSCVAFKSCLSPSAVPADQFIVSAFATTAVPSTQADAAEIRHEVTLLILCILLLIAKLTFNPVSL